LKCLSSHAYQPVDRESCRLLADALGDAPETVISVHQLRRGLCRAYVAGAPPRFRGAIVQGDDLPEEPTGFGSDAAVLWELLRSLEGWECVNVSTEVAPALGNIMEKHLGAPVRYYGDIYHVLDQPVRESRHEAVRQLTLDDLELLQSAPVASPGGGFGGPRPLLTHGVVACAIVSGRIVCLAQTYARSERHADIGVFTHEDWRGRGFATAAAAIVARRVQEAGQTPVWSTGEDNWASLRVAQKLGFTKISQRTYVIPQRSG